MSNGRIIQCSMNKQYVEGSKMSVGNMAGTDNLFWKKFKVILCWKYVNYFHYKRPYA